MYIPKETNIDIDSEVNRAIKVLNFIVHIESCIWVSHYSYRKEINRKKDSQECIL